MFDVTFCGDWAGGVYGKSGCPMSGSDSSQSCINYVAKNPTAFEQTYWEINSVKIYQTGVAAKTVVSTLQSTSSTQAPATQAGTEPSATQADNTARVSAASTSAEASAAAVTAGTVGELGGDVSSATSQTMKISTTRYVTEFVTSTTTICPIAGPSASFAAAAESKALAALSVQTSNVGNIPATAVSTRSEPSSATNSVKEVQTQPVAETTVISTPVAASNSQAASSQTLSHSIGADAESSGVPENLSASGVLPTIILAPGASSAPASSLLISNASKTKSAAIVVATGASAASGSSFQGSTSSAISPVFTGAAERASIKFSAIIAAFMLALMA